MDLDALRVTAVDTDKVCVVAKVGIRFGLHESQKGRLRFGLHTSQKGRRKLGFHESYKGRHKILFAQVL